MLLLDVVLLPFVVEHMSPLVNQRVDRKVVLLAIVDHDIGPVIVLVARAEQASHLASANIYRLALRVGEVLLQVPNERIEFRVH